LNILTIDASTKSTGVAVFENKELKFYDCFTASSKDVIERIKKITSSLKELLDKIDIKIDKVILEEVRPENGGFEKSIQTNRVLMWLQGQIAITVHEYYDKDVEIVYIYPSTWRSACGIQTGRGKKRNTLKQEDINFVKNKFKIDVNDDIADAIGIGWGFLNSTTKEEKCPWD